MKNILIPTDFSKNAWNAIEYVVQFFSKTTCNFYLLHVDTPDVLEDECSLCSSNENITNDVLIQPTKKRLQEVVKQIKDQFSPNRNHRFFTISDKDYMINSIRRQVLEKRINLIVMGTKGISGLKNLPIGSNAGNVITKVKCTTLVVPENAKYELLKEIVFPTDFSIFYKLETLQPISDIVETNDVAVRILHVSKNGDELNEDQQKNKEYLDDYFTNNEHSFHFLTNKYLDEAVQNFVDSKGINLITMLAKNLNYFHKILFNPTLKEINYYKNIPFLVLH